MKAANCVIDYSDGFIKHKNGPQGYKTLIRHQIPQSISYGSPDTLNTASCPRWAHLLQHWRLMLACCYNQHVYLVGGPHEADDGPLVGVLGLAVYDGEMVLVMNLLSVRP